MTVGERIRERRKTLGLTQKQFGERIGRGRGWVEHIERGRLTVKIGDATRMSKVLGLPEADLLQHDSPDRPLDMVSE